MKGRGGIAAVLIVVNGRESFRPVVRFSHSPLVVPGSAVGLRKRLWAVSFFARCQVARALCKRWSGYPVPELSVSAVSGTSLPPLGQGFYVRQR